MSGRKPSLTAIRGRVDNDGRLVAADPELAGLQARAGGEEGGALALPQIAALARLARRLGIVISRGVMVADSTTSTITGPTRWKPWRTAPASRTRLSGSPVASSIARHVRSSDEVITTT